MTSIKETQEQFMERARVTLVDRDVMPRQVAVEMLARPGVRLTSRDRRMYRDALANYFSSTLTQKPLETKLAFKLQHSTWAQLNKWLKRVTKRYTAMNKRYSEFQAKLADMKNDDPKKLLMLRTIAAFEVIMEQVRISLECLENEHDRRAALSSVADKISTEELGV